MKTLKFLLPVAALLMSSIAFAQRNHGRVKNDNGIEKRTEARTNGARQANANANVRAQQNANENSVLQGTTTVNTRQKARVNRTEQYNRKYIRKKKGF